MLTIDGATYVVPSDFYDKLVENYGQDLVAQELNAMEMWLLANPKNRKTKGGMTRFINSWLKRTKATGGVSPYAAQHKTVGPKNDDSIRGRSLDCSLTDISWLSGEEKQIQKQFYLTRRGFYFDGGFEVKRA